YLLFRLSHSSFLLLPPPPRPTLFPYTTLFRSMSLPWPDRSFDVVICGDLIEHLRDPERFLVRVRPLLRPGGRLVLTTPNVANWRSEEHTSELQSRGHLVCRLLLEKKTDTQTTA